MTSSMLFFKKETKKKRIPSLILKGQTDLSTGIPLVKKIKKIKSPTIPVLLFFHHNRDSF